MPRYHLENFRATNCDLYVDTDKGTIEYIFTDGRGDEIYSIEEQKDGLSRYLYCPVCGEPHDLSTNPGRLMAGWAFHSHQQRNCGTECSQKEYRNRYACCDQAVPVNCVCVASFQCPVHGRRCHGSHD